ncbi:thrombospondin type 3 repeat-containing protein [Archangium violaceum]|uniref:OmpA family protein n=1 Tax=Archangium violaceum TaxID=83451 RepID=UPI00194EA3CF|nr:OmpA family protein [Archangium violaceum]QRO00181.1 thrombospondin type 3 repeat-containing protein [Archangium violaceum]
MSYTKPRPPLRSAEYVRLSALATLLLASTALAQSTTSLPRFELERLELNPNGRGSLVMGTGELMEPGGFRLSLLGHYEKDPLVLYADETPVGSVVGDRAMAHLLLAWAPLRWLELGLQVPLVVWQRGDDLTAQGISSPARTGLSTPSVNVRVGLLSQRRDAPLDLAVDLGVGLPVGSEETISRDSTFRFSPRLMLGRRFGLIRAGVEAGAMIRPTVTLINDETVRDEVGNEVHLGAVLATTGRGLRGELNVRGTLPLTRQPKSLELLAGVRLPLGSLAEAYALGGPGFGDTPGTPSFRVLLGVALGGSEPPDVGPRDDDGDGVPNSEDACPNEPGPASRKGCPVKDTDGDGLDDSVDRCPREPGPAENQGCAGEKDTDGDGVADSADKCPKEPGLAADQGCPVKDRDGDGIEDTADKCPREAGPAARQGCPVKDTDGDGVVDERDACPTEAGLVELRGCAPKDTDGDTVSDHLDNCPQEKGVVTNQGCPPQQEQLVAIQKGKLEIKQAVFFATNKAIIQRRSYKMLDQIARVIQQHPEIDKIVIEGHTDNVGNPEVNRKLSLARAESVRDYLVKKGVEPSRLEARGFGPDRPLLPNKTSRGRAANRRVAFTIVNPDSEQ